MSNYETSVEIVDNFYEFNGEEIVIGDFHESSSQIIVDQNGN